MVTKAIYTLGLEKRNLWGLGVGLWFVVASLPFAKMIPRLQCAIFQLVHWFEKLFFIEFFSQEAIITKKNGIKIAHWSGISKLLSVRLNNMVSENFHQYITQSGVRNR